MLTYKEKLLNEISQLDDAQMRKFYHFFQVLKKEFLSAPEGDWQKELRNISVWKDDNFDEIAEGFKNWQIREFSIRP